MIERSLEGRHSPEKGFVVRVEDEEELFRFLRPLNGYIRFKPMEFLLGSTRLTHPLKRVELLAFTTGQELGFGARFFAGEDSLLPLSADHLSSRLRPAGLGVTVEETPDIRLGVSRTIRIFEIGIAEFRRRFNVGGPVGDASLVINNLDHLWGEDWKRQRIETLAKFRREGFLFSSVVQALVEAIYLGANQEIPDVELVLGKEPINKKVSLVDIWEGGEDEIPAMTFAEIGGQERAVEQMKEITFALKDPESFRRWGTRLPRGVLLVGPPGNGKTLLGKAMAHETEAHFVPVNISDILICWVGSSERKITALFDEAKRRKGKTILFFDELDALGRSREKTVHEHTASLLLTISQNIDGIKKNPNVIVIGTTNRKEDIDPALLREGRFDIIVGVNLPSSTGREKILAIHVAKAEKEAGRRVFGEIDCRLLAEKTKGASGARLAEIVRRATWKRAVEEVAAKEGGSQTGFTPITTQEILEIIEDYEER